MNPPCLQFPPAPEPSAEASAAHWPLYCSWDSSQLASILPHLMSKPAPQSNQVRALTSAPEKGRTSARTRPTDPLPGTLSKHMASPDSVCPVSTKETAHAVCQRGPRAWGLRGGSRRGWWGTSTLCFTPLTADCHTRGPQFKNTLAKLPPVPRQK